MLGKVALKVTERHGSARKRLGIRLRYEGEEGESIELSTAAQLVDPWILRELRRLYFKHESVRVRVGISGDVSTGPSVLTQHLSDVAPFYAFASIDLTVATDFQDFNTLVLTQPDRPYSDAELHCIDDFLLLGGKTVLVLASAANVIVEREFVTPTLDWHGLERFLVGYGIVAQRNLLLSARTVARLGEQAAGPFALTDLIQPLSVPASDTFAPLFGIARLSTAFSSSLVLNRPARGAGVALTPIALASGVTLESGSPSGGPPFRVAAAAQTHVVGALVEGIRTSAFDPAARRRAPAPSSIVIIASPAWLESRHVSPWKAHYDDGSALTAFINLLDWSNSDVDARACMKQAPRP